MTTMKFDLHTHTYYSNDAITSPEKLVRGAKEKGLDGIAITDHNTTRAWKGVRAAAKKHDLKVVFGEEIKIFHGPRKVGEALGLFLNETISPGELPAVKDAVKDQGGVLVMAHPFDYFRNRFKMAEEYKREFDAVEAINSRAVVNWFNNKAIDFAGRNHMAVVAGSDAHCLYELGNAYTLADVGGAGGLRKAILGKRTSVRGVRTNPFIHILSTLTKLGFRKRR